MDFRYFFCLVVPCCFYGHRLVVLLVGLCCPLHVISVPGRVVMPWQACGVPLPGGLVWCYWYMCGAPGKPRMPLTCLCCPWHVCAPHDKHVVPLAVSEKWPAYQFS